MNTRTFTLASLTTLLVVSLKCAETVCVMMLALVAIEILLVLWVQDAWGWSLIKALLWLTVLDLVLAGLSLRIGGQLAKGPYLPQTLEGLSKTTRAVMGRS